MLPVDNVPGVRHERLLHAPWLTSAGGGLAATSAELSYHAALSGCRCRASQDSSHGACPLATTMVVGSTMISASKTDGHAGLASEKRRREHAAIRYSRCVYVKRCTYLRKLLAPHIARSSAVFRQATNTVSGGISGNVVSALCAATRVG